MDLLGPTFANYYMYARYVDDNNLEIENENSLIKLKEKFENITVLKFTYEINLNNKLPFLDVLLNNNNNIMKTTIYKKETNKNQCLNYNSESDTSTRLMQKKLKH